MQTSWLGSSATLYPSEWLKSPSSSYARTVERSLSKRLFAALFHCEQRSDSFLLELPVTRVHLQAPARSKVRYDFLHHKIAVQPWWTGHAHWEGLHLRKWLSGRHLQYQEVLTGHGGQEMGACTIHAQWAYRMLWFRWAWEGDHIASRAILEGVQVC